MVSTSGIFRVILGSYGENRREHGNYYNELGLNWVYRVYPPVTVEAGRLCGGALNEKSHEDGSQDTRDPCDLLLLKHTKGQGGVGGMVLGGGSGNAQRRSICGGGGFLVHP